MNRSGKINLFSIRIAGAIIGAVGFILLAFRQNVIGTALVGIGSVLIAAGEK